MPRNGSGIYSKPAGTTAQPNTTIESAKYNQTVDDLVADANVPRPIVAGGHGAATVSGAQTNLSLDNKIVYAAKSGAYTAVAADNNSVLRFTATATLSLTAVATLGTNWHVTVIADGGDVTIDPNGSETINGASTLIVKSRQSAFIISNGTAFFCQIFGEPISGEALRGYLIGLTLSNNVGDSTNDIDIGSGDAASDGTIPSLMILGAGITKRLDAAWAVGTNQGGLDTGALANGTYHVFLIQRSDTGVVDALFSASPTSPTMPANYDRKRRIGSIIRQSGAILPFIQIGDEFQLSTPIVDVSVTNPGAAAVNRTLSVPFGIIVNAKMIAVLANTAATATANLNLTSPLVNNTISAFSITGVANTSGRPQQLSSTVSIITNQSAQIRANLNYSDANVSYSIVTLGWTDYRGRQF